MIWNDCKAKIEEVDLSFATTLTEGIHVSILREDLNHPAISGNKYRKLKYNFLEADKLGISKILTFGGAFSNHIAAVAAAGEIYGFRTVGIVRGEELQDKIQENSTLRYAERCGMKLYFISREKYRLKNSTEFLENLKKEFPETYFIPEGGTNELAIKGCKEILHDECFDFDFITSSVGTCGTIAGLIERSKANQTVLGFPSLKGNFLDNEVKKLTKKRNFTLFNNYHFGGYGKVSEELITFVNNFKRFNAIQLDPIYTGKMVYGLCQLLKNNYFKKNSRILIVHTGGLQGIEGINNLQKRKNKIIIE